MTTRGKQVLAIGALILAFAITAGTLSNLIGTEELPTDDDSGDDDSGDDDSAPFSTLPPIPQEAL